MRTVGQTARPPKVLVRRFFYKEEVVYSNSATRSKTPSHEDHFIQHPVCNKIVTFPELRRHDEKKINKVKIP